MNWAIKSDYLLDLFDDYTVNHVLAGKSSKVRGNCDLDSSGSRRRRRPTFLVQAYRLPSIVVVIIVNDHLTVLVQMREHR